HRGNRVVRCDDGNAKRFMCTYHGWTYRNDGALDHVPGESEAYYDALDRPSLGLIEARVEPYAGIVFATWAKDAPSLEAYLRDADDNTPRFVHGMSKDNLRLFQEYHEATMPEVERRLGNIRARRVQLANHSIFPNGILGLRLALPRGPLKTEFWHFVLVDRE